MLNVAIKRLQYINGICKIHNYNDCLNQHRKNYNSQVFRAPNEWPSSFTVAYDYSCIEDSSKMHTNNSPEVYLSYFCGGGARLEIYHDFVWR